MWLIPFTVAFTIAFAIIYSKNLKTKLNIINSRKYILWDVSDESITSIITEIW